MLGCLNQKLHNFGLTGTHFELFWASEPDMGKLRSQELISSYFWAPEPDIAKRASQELVLSYFEPLSQIWPK